MRFGFLHPLFYFPIEDDRSSAIFFSLEMRAKYLKDRMTDTSCTMKGQRVCPVWARLTCSLIELPGCSEFHGSIPSSADSCLHGIPIDMIALLTDVSPGDGDIGAEQYTANN